LHRFFLARISIAPFCSLRPANDSSSPSPKKKKKACLTASLRDSTTNRLPWHIALPLREAASATTSFDAHMLTLASRIGVLPAHKVSEHQLIHF
jgi:hypothetical protein